MSLKNKTCCCWCRFCRWLWGNNFGSFATGLGAIGAVILGLIYSSDIADKIEKLFNSTNEIKNISEEIKERVKDLEEMQETTQKIVTDLKEGFSKLSASNTVQNKESIRTPESLKKTLEADFGKETAASRPWGIYIPKKQIQAIIEESRNQTLEPKALEKRIYESIVIPSRPNTKLK